MGSIYPVVRIPHRNAAHEFSFRPEEHVIDWLQSKVWSNLKYFQNWSQSTYQRIGKQN